MNDITTLDTPAPTSYPDCPALDKALRAGEKLHGFRSGGGLRVVSLKNEESAYGEHPYIQEALRICEEDCQAGGRPYQEVYGKRYPHYLTGSSTPSSYLDRLTLRGTSWDIVWDGKRLVLKFEYTSYGSPVPKHISDGVVDAYKKYRYYSELWSRQRSWRKHNKYYKQMSRWHDKLEFYFQDHRGIVYEITPWVTAAGSVGFQTNVYHVPAHLDRQKVSENRHSISINGGYTLADTFPVIEAKLASFFKKLQKREA